jgi:hypothetical protein
MDDYGVSPFQMMRMLGPVMVIGPLLLWLLISGPFVLYPIARWRANRDATPDPQLGLKVALEYFRMLTFQLGLFGSVMVLFTMFSKMPSSDKGDVYRVGFGLLVPAAILFAAHAVMLAKTNQDRYLVPRRLFGGYNLVVTGLVGMTAFMLVFQALFAKGSSGDFGRFAIAMLLVYGGAWAGCGVRFLRLVRDDVGQPPAAPAAREGAPPLAAPPPPAAPGLPSLGGGAFPPIDR